MAQNTLDLIKETARQAATGDNKFYRQFLYYFELRIPARIGAALGGTSFFFPLIINPQSYTLEEPFTVEATPTMGGGLYVEENGIVQRTIRIQGHTGFKPRKLARQPLSLYAVKGDSRSHARMLSPVVPDLISGQRHFQYLQDAVFRTYADLKKDPATSEETRLLFHIPKDDEHWLVVPRSFTLTRQASSPLTYNYSIDLLVVGPGDKDNQVFASEDRTRLEKYKDAIAMVKSGTNLVSAGIRDLSAMSADLQSTIKDTFKIIDGCTEIVEAADGFVNGVANIVNIPYAFLNSMSNLVDAGVKLANDVYNLPGKVSQAIKEFPTGVEHILRNMQDGLNRIAMHPEVFSTPTEALMAAQRAAQELSTSVSTDDLDAAADTAAPSSFAGLASMGTALLPGDKERAAADLGLGRSAPKYTGAETHTISSGDTLANLASRYLGDARLWYQIAVLNGLKPPFINEQADANLANADKSPLSGTVGMGSQILIPNFAAPATAQPLLPVLGVRREAPAEEQFLGADLALEKRADGLYDVVIDTEHGSLDLKTVSGIANLSQALIQRLETEKGTDTLYRNVGMAPIVALNMTEVDMETARFRVSEALTADPRVATVRGVTFTTPTADALAIDATVEIRGFAQASNVKVTL